MSEPIAEVRAEQDAEPIAIIRACDGYKGLLRAFRLQRDRLNVSAAVLDELAGLSDTHTSKLHAGTQLFGEMSFGATLGSHALMLVVIEDTEQLARIKSLMTKNGQLTRDEKQVMRGKARHRETTIINTREKLRKWGARGGKGRAKVLSPYQRRMSAKRAARARWNRVREQRAATRNAPGKTLLQDEPEILSRER